MPTFEPSAHLLAAEQVRAILVEELHDSEMDIWRLKPAHVEHITKRLNVAFCPLVERLERERDYFKGLLPTAVRIMSSRGPRPPGRDPCQGAGSKVKLTPWCWYDRMLKLLGLVGLGVAAGSLFYWR